MEDKSFTNIIGGQFQVMTRYPVISIIKHTTNDGEQAEIIIEKTNGNHLHLYHIALKPKSKSHHAEVVHEGVNLSDLENLKGLSCQSWNIPAAKINDLLGMINQQKRFQIDYQKNANSLTYTSRSWINPDQPRTNSEWCIELMKGIQLSIGKWEKFNLYKKSASHLQAAPPAELPASSAPAQSSAGFFSPGPESAANLCMEGERCLERKDYFSAITNFKRALALEANHRASKLGYQLSLQEIVIQAYNKKEYVEAQQHLQDLLKLDPNDAFAKDGLLLIEDKLKPAARADISNQLAVVEAKNLPFNIENLVFQGGGIKGLAYIGSLNELLTQQYNFRLEQIIRVAGASAGAIIALALGMGYSMQETSDILAATNFTDFFDGEFKEPFIALNARQKELAEKFKGVLKGNPVGIVSNAASMYVSDPDVDIIKKGLSVLQEEDFGLFNGEVIRVWLDNLVRAKTDGNKLADGNMQGGIIQATFKELHDLKQSDPERYKHFKEMYFVAVNLNTNQIEIFSFEHTPHVIVSDAARASLSIPLVYKAHRVHYKDPVDNSIKPYANGNLYVDGGLLSNLPIWLFDHGRYLPMSIGDNHQINPYTLGFKLVNSDKKSYYERGEQFIHPTSNNILNYVKQVVECIFSNRERYIPGEEHQERIVMIDNKGVKTTDFALTDFQRDRLLLAGKQGIQDYFQRIRNINLHHLIPILIHHHYLDYLDVNQVDGDGNTILHTAVRNGDISLVAYLCMQRDADFKNKAVTNRAHQTIWIVAQNLQHAHRAQILETLERSGFNPDKPLIKEEPLAVGMNPNQVRLTM